jgi:hypothetical protein
MITLALSCLTLAITAVAWWILRPGKMRPSLMLWLILVVAAVLALVIWASQNHVDVWSM